MVRGRKSSRAFTLIELLAVVAVIILLLSILVPTMGAARKRAGLVPCMNNLRQLYSLCVGFAGDNNGDLPQGLSENPQQLSARAGYTTFALLNKYMNDFGFTPKIWYCPSFRNVNLIATDAWGDDKWYQNGVWARTGTPGEFPIGYFYAGNVTPGSIWKFEETPPVTLTDLANTNGTFIWDYCQAPRPSPIEAKDVPLWNFFSHYGLEDAAVCQYMSGGGSAFKKKIDQMKQRYHYIGNAEVFW